MDGTVLIGFAKVIGISLVPVALFGAVIHGHVVVDRGRALARRLHLLAPQAPATHGPPLERLAADLRRLRPLACSPRPGVPMARHRGTVAAYDLVLADTARALAVPTRLPELPTLGIDREAERLRLEHALEQAGLSWETGGP